MDIALTIGDPRAAVPHLAQHRDGIGAKIGKKIRDALFFKDLARTYDTSDMTGVRLREMISEFSAQRDVLEVVYNDLILRVHLLFFQEQGGQENRHFSLRIGGSDEDLEIGAARLDPYLKAYQKKQKRAGSKDLERRGEDSGVSESKEGDSEEEGFEVLTNPLVLQGLPVPPARVESIDKCARLTMIQMSFYDIEATGRPWRPTSFVGFGDVVFLILAELGRRHQKIDSLICHSEGSSVLEGLERRDPDLIPETIILDRAMPSVFKKSRQSHPYLHRILFPFARRFGWAGDPEKSLKLADLPNTQIIQITAPHDAFFSGANGWDGSFATETNAAEFDFLPSSVFLAREAHHSVSASFYKVSEERRLTPWFEIRDRESVIDAIARQIFIPFNVKKMLKEASSYVGSSAQETKDDLYSFIEQVLKHPEFQKNPRVYIDLWVDKSGPIADLARQFLRLHFHA
jgi:hypothetical protein